MKEEYSQLTEEIAGMLKQDIISGKYPPGTKLPAERDLAEALDVSRITVRGAISRLAQLGFVATRPGSGSYVKDYLNGSSFDLLLDIVSSNQPVDIHLLKALLDLRKIVEMYCAEKSAVTVSQEDISFLEGIVSDIETEMDIDEIIERDFSFHEFFVKKSGNPVMVILFNMCRPVYLFYLKFFYSIDDNRGAILPLYKRLIGALKLRDPSYGKFVMGEIMDYAEGAVKKGLDGIETVSIPVLKK